MSLGSIVGKESLSDGDMPDFGHGSESGQVDQPTVGSILQVDSVFVLAESVGQKHRQEDPEECGDEHAALLDSTVDGEWVWYCAIEADRATHVDVKWLDNGVQLWGTADLFQELEESSSADKIEYLRQVYEGEQERFILLLALLLQLSHGKDHVDSGSTCFEPTRTGTRGTRALPRHVVGPRWLWQTF